MIEEIKKLIEEQATKNIRFFKDWERYQTKRAEIFERKMPKAQKVNNKINHDYVGVIINTKVGHFLGNGISISVDNDEDGNKSKEITQFRRYTAFDRVITEVGVQASVFGYGCIYAYIDENGKFNFIEVDPWNVYFGKNIVIREIPQEEETSILEVFDKEKKYYFLKKGEEITELSEFDGQASGLNHLFSDIPIFKVKNNKEEVSETYRVRHNINAVDRMYSDLSSELEQFRLAYLKFKGIDVETEDILAMLQVGAISFKTETGNEDVDFITKTVDILGILEAIKKEEENIFKFAQSYDATRDRAGYGQLTNLGIHFLMAPLNNNCKKTIHYFKEALYKLFTFYSETTDGNYIDPLELTFTFTLDTPRNILEESQVQQNLTGIVSDETRLGLATFIEDAKEELKKMETEKVVEDETTF